MRRDYGEILHLATELQYYSGYLDSIELKQQLDVRNAFKSAANRFVFDLLKAHPGPGEAAAIVSADLDALAGSDEPPLEGALAETRAYLDGRIGRESRKSPRLRTVIRWSPVAIGVVAILVYLGIRYFSILDVSAPIASREGLRQRAAAYEKVRAYHFPSGGFSLRRIAVEIYAWPGQPTDEEIAAARELVRLSAETLTRLAQSEEICLDPSRNPNGVTEQQQLELVHEVATYLRDERSRWAEPPGETLTIPIKRAFPCR